MGVLIHKRRVSSRFIQTHGIDYQENIKVEEEVFMHLPSILKRCNARNSKNYPKKYIPNRVAFTMRTVAYNCLNYIIQLTNVMSLATSFKIRFLYKREIKNYGDLSTSLELKLQDQGQEFFNHNKNTFWIYLRKAVR